MNIAIGITTKNRRECAQFVISQWQKHLPDNAQLFIVDDGSDTPYPDANFRFENSVGICIAKNKALELCEGADYIFIADDDIYPTFPLWHEPYIKSGLNHACWNYDRKFLTLTPNYVEYETPNGCLLFFKKICLETVGGWDTDFKGYGFDHVNLSDRIYNNSLTPARYIDARDTRGLFTMMVCRSYIPHSVRVASIPVNHKLYQKKFLSKEFKPFK
jgi:glycosyltransferase involved in cell wall biosynthesis